jgi:hypothetical protein
MPTVYRGNTTTTVKNLGWLLKHASECQKIFITRAGYDNQHAHMYANGMDEQGRLWVYSTLWASYKLACQWVKRRALAHTTVTFD